jgi:hypothetical protein
MTAIELAKKVTEVREAQRKYYANRSMDKLVECKKLEKELDRLLTEIILDQPMMLTGFTDQ